MGRNTLSHAVSLARMNPVKGLPRMAAILKCWNGITTGRNSRKTHPLMAKFGRNSKSICLHAEIDAIRNAIRRGLDPEGATMYVARVTRDGKPALAKPCEGCQRAIVAFGIKDVQWTGEN